MPRFTRTLLIVSLATSMLLSGSAAQEPTALPTPDERYKADLLLVVAHPDDEGAATPYLARALDEHRRIAVVFGTRGSSGANEAGAEQAGALGAIREIEARNALTTLGINNVWFLGGKDTASQNVLLSLANWDHGVSLDSLPSHQRQAKYSLNKLDQIDEEQIEKMATSYSFWTEALHFVLGKSLVTGSVTGDVFEGITPGAIPFARPEVSPEPARPELSVDLGGPYSFYAEFRRAHGLMNLPHPEPPEIALQGHTTLVILLRVRNRTGKMQEISLAASLPAGTTTEGGTGKFTVAAETVGAPRPQGLLPS